MVTKKPKRTKRGSSEKTTNEGGLHFHGNATIGGDAAGRDINIKAGRDYKRGDTNIAVRDKLFEEVYKQIEERPDTSPEDKADLKANVEEIKAEAAKGEQANESFLARRFRNIMRMAPDILEVVTSAIVNPAAGFTTLVTKIAKKAAESKNAA
jgi:Ternary complex associated domain 2